MGLRHHAFAVFAPAGVALLMAACQPTSPQDGEPGPGAGLGPISDAVPADHDWHLTLHGGSGDLAFGDGDWAEGERLLQLSCLPRSGQAEITWPGEGEAVLTAGTATETVAHASRMSTGHPVMTAFKDTGAITVGRGETDHRLVAQAAGRGELADFFAYCDQGREPRAALEPPPIPEEPVQAEVQTATPPPIEPQATPEALADPVSPSNDPQPRPAEPEATADTP